MTALAVTAKTFGQRPSALLGVNDPVLALAIDLAATVKLHLAAEPEPKVNRVYL